MSKFDYNKRDLYHAITEEVRDLEAEFAGLAPVNILTVNLENSYTQHEIADGINDLVKNNVIQTDGDNYLKSCY